MRCHYYDEWRGPVDNILYQSKLIGLRGQLPHYSFYKPASLQRSDTAVSFVFENAGPIKRLV